MWHYRASSERTERFDVPASAISFPEKSKNSGQHGQHGQQGSERGGARVVVVEKTEHDQCRSILSAPRVFTVE